MVLPQTAETKLEAAYDPDTASRVYPQWSQSQHTTERPAHPSSVLHNSQGMGPVRCPSAEKHNVVFIHSVVLFNHEGEKNNVLYCEMGGMKDHHTK